METVRILVVLVWVGDVAFGRPHSRGTLATEELGVLGETLVFNAGPMFLLLSCKGSSWNPCWSLGF